jgi:hypothetical protein
MKKIRWPWSKPTWRERWWFHRDDERVGTQPDAADFNLAVTLVAPWEEYVLDLSPDFKIKDGDAALQHVIPDTASLEEKLVESFTASAKVNAGLDVGSKGAGGAAGHKEKSSEESGPAKEKPPEEKPQGDKPAAATSKNSTQGGSAPASAEGNAAEKKPPADQSSGKPAQGDKAARHGDSGEAAPRKPSGKDPMLEYTAATAFYQEVKLLNRYVADAALRRGYRAYVVRLQMSVVPFARQLPLDVYSNISFFPTVEPSRKEKEKGANARHYRAEVIPLLVTDNLENTIRSRNTESLRNLALTLNFLQSGVGGSVALGQKRDEFQRALGGDLNSLLTVGRVSDNTLQVRLGAERDVACDSGYSMLPRTHNITILVMVPREFADVADDQRADPAAVARITAVAKTQLRYVKTGQALVPQEHNRRRTRVEHLFHGEVLADDLPEVAEKLRQSVFRNDVGAFERDLRDAKFAKVLKDREQIKAWVEFANSLLGNNDAHGCFEKLAHSLKLSGTQKPELKAGLQEAIASCGAFKQAVQAAGLGAADAQSLWSAIAEDAAMMSHLTRQQVQRAVEGEVHSPDGEALRWFSSYMVVIFPDHTLVTRGIFTEDANQTHRDAVAHALWHAVRRFGDFADSLKDIVARPTYMEDLWCSIVETFGASEYAAVRFELPPSARLPSDKAVLAVDDGKDTIVHLQGGAGLNQNGVTATLFVRRNEYVTLPIVPRSEPPGSEIVIPAGGHGMTLKFP